MPQWPSGPGQPWPDTASIGRPRGVVAMEDAVEADIDAMTKIAGIPTQNFVANSGAKTPPPSPIRGGPGSAIGAWSAHGWAEGPARIRRFGRGPGGSTVRAYDKAGTLIRPPNPPMRSDEPRF
jgi:hypothetical protein